MVFILDFVEKRPFDILHKQLDFKSLYVFLLCPGHIFSYILFFVGFIVVSYLYVDLYAVCQEFQLPFLVMFRNVVLLMKNLSSYFGYLLH